MATAKTSSARNPVQFEFPAGICTTYTAEAPYKSGDSTAPNEDNYLVLQAAEQSVVFAVADGAGGYANGQHASALAVQHLRTAIDAESGDPSSLREAILNAIDTTNAELLADGQGSATTIAVAELQGSVLRPYHVGDSSIIVTGQRGLIKLQTISHSPVGFGIEAGLLEVDAALQHDNRHWVSNLIGTTEMRIEVGAPQTLGRFDTVLLCSDGLTDNVAQRDITETIRKGPLTRSITELARTCTDGMAAENGHPDDLTLLLYRQSR